MDDLTIQDSKMKDWKTGNWKMKDWKIENVLNLQSSHRRWLDKDERGD